MHQHRIQFIHQVPLLQILQDLILTVYCDLLFLLHFSDLLKGGRELSLFIRYAWFLLEIWIGVLGDSGPWVE